jgi:predicted TIM-barrel fold metal-dependent hydrolase
LTASIEGTNVIDKLLLAAAKGEPLMANALSVIDADAHVIETERTWDYLEPSEKKYRPQLFFNPGDATRQFWVIDDKIRGFRFPTLSEQELRDFSDRAGRNFATPQAARELDDVDLRLRHMDELGIDIQVLHNTFWIEQITTRPEIEAALCRSWNRWLADVYKQSNGRLRYSCVVPALNIQEAVAQIKFAKENGAVAVCMRPLEGDRHLTDPDFYPIYQAASDLDLAIAVHIANGNPANADLYRLAPAGRFAQFRVPTVTSCFGLVMSEVPNIFPKLRWGFIEASAQWVPWIYREAAIRYRVANRVFSENLFEAYNIFVTCQTNDDIPYIVRYAGENRLVIGTDYGHTDPSSAVTALNEFQRMEGIASEVKEKILSHNAKALYGL